jgi:hypothetical protein
LKPKTSLARSFFVYIIKVGAVWIMKKIILSFVFLLTLACPSLADSLSDNEKVLDSADSLSDNEKTLDSGSHDSSDQFSDNKEVLGSNALQSHKRVNISIEPEISSYLYKEPGCMKLNGIKYGLQANIDIQRSVSSFFAMQFRFMTGSVDYDGHLMEEDKEEITFIPYKYNGGMLDRYFELRGLWGLALGSDPRFEWRPFWGAGIRILYNRLSDMPLPSWLKNRNKYDRISCYTYIPLGVSFKYYCGEGLSFDICGEADYMPRGVQIMTANIDGVDKVGALPQANGYGLRFSGKISKKLKNKNIKLFAGPFIRYWSIPDSTKAFTEDGKKWQQEPKNHTIESGIKLGISF